MEDEILSQDIEEEEDELSGLEKEEEEELRQKPKAQSKKVAKRTQEQSEEVKETYEIYMQPAQFGVVNTLSGEFLGGFDVEKDQAIVNLAKFMLNKLDKISIASGA